MAFWPLLSCSFFIKRTSSEVRFLYFGVSGFRATSDSDLHPNGFLARAVRSSGELG